MAHELCGIVMSIDAEDEGETTGAHKHGLVLLASTSTAPTGALPDGVRASAREDAMRSKAKLRRASRWRRGLGPLDFRPRP